MKNKELFTLDPTEVNLKNEGVAKIRAINETEDYSIAEYELKTFVCEGEYHEGLKKILEVYLNNYSSTEQPAFWVSGFYGSGKSHLVKMASYLWEDFAFPNGKTARNIKPLPQDIQDLFVELDRKQKTQGRLSVAGTLRDFPSKDIRYSFLQIFLNNLGLPQQYHHFKFIHWLKNEGIYDAVEAILEAAGKQLRTEVERIFVSTALARAVLELKPELAENEAKLLEQFRAQFARVETIGKEEFIRAIREEILPMKFGDKIPCTLIILDEVQQFIDKDATLSLDVQFMAEDLSSRFDGKFLLVGTGQNALTDTPSLQRLTARFRIPVQLTNTDIQTVIRKTILDKKASAIPPLNAKLEAASGEIARNLEGSVFGYLTEDKQTLAADYPVLPSTRKFWYKVLQVVDVAGTSGQLRNQLRLIDDSLKSIADGTIGQIVPADFIFTQTRAELIQAGILLNDASNLIQSKKAQGGDVALQGRILSAAFLLDQVTSKIPDTGLKANENTLADLLIDDLNTHSDSFRNKVKTLIKELVEERSLMPVNDEYKLQTKTGAEWQQEFHKQSTRISSSGEDQIHSLRRERILGYFKSKTQGIAVFQGNSRIARDFELWDKEAMPNTEHKLNLWLRDGWNESIGHVENEIRAAGNHKPLAYVFVKAYRDTELKTEIVKYLAALQTIQTMGLPSTPEGEQAKRSMETRQMQAKNAIGELIERICSEAVVYLAGGNKIQSGDLKANIQEALNSIADRQFPEFNGKADFSNWGQALNRAQAGNPDALTAIQYNGDVDKHPVAAEILRFIGPSSKSGKDIRNHFMKAPYGWPQDAIDTLLMLLSQSQHISTTESDLKPARINQANFKKEVHILSAKDKIEIKKLFQAAGINFPPNKEIFPFSNEYLDKLKILAAQVGGEAPRPEPVSTEFIRQIEDLEGNERLLAILSQTVMLQSRFSEWTAQAAIVQRREPLWQHLIELLNYAPDGQDCEQIRTDAAAIRDNRLLLQEPDLVEPLLIRLSDKLLSILNQRKTDYNALYDARMAELQANEYFKKLEQEQKHSILHKHQLLAKPEIKALDAHALLNQLNKASLYTWNTKIAALPGQFQSALEDAVKLSAPKAQTFSLPRRTLSSQAEIDAYVAELKTELEALLQESSSIILK